MVLANAVNLSSGSEADKYRVEISASGAFIVMDEALRASQMIPSGKTASEAANEFCTWMLRNLHDNEKAADPDFSLPLWFAR